MEKLWYTALIEERAPSTINIKKDPKITKDPLEIKTDTNVWIANTDV